MGFNFREAAQQFGFTHEEHDTGGTKFPTRVDTTVHHPETGEQVGSARYFPPKRRGGPIHIDDVQAHTPGAGSAVLNEIENRHPGSTMKFLHEVKRNNNNPDKTGHAHERAGAASDWDTHYPNLQSTVHRGFSLRLPSHAARTVNSSSSTVDEHLKALHSEMTGSLGMHWTENEHAARQFAHNAVSDHRTDVPVVLHATTPERKDIETRKDHLYRGGVFAYGDEHSPENEVPFRKGRTVKVTGISWRPDAAHPDADEHGWVHHTYSEPMHHTAAAIEEDDDAGSVDRRGSDMVESTGPEEPEGAIGSETPAACSYCGSTAFEGLTDNGRVRQATCSACGGTMSAHDGAQWTPELIGDPSNHPKPDGDPRSGGVGGAAAVGMDPIVRDTSRLAIALPAPPHDADTRTPNEDEEHWDAKRAGFAGWVGSSKDHTAEHQDPELHYFLGRKQEDDPNEALWRSIEPTHVSLKQPIYATQPGVDAHGVHTYLNNKYDRGRHVNEYPDEADDYHGNEMPAFVKHEGRMHVIEGHHRTSAEILRGSPHIRGRVYDADEQGFPHQQREWHQGGAIALPKHDHDVVHGGGSVAERGQHLYDALPRTERGDVHPSVKSRARGDFERTQAGAEAQVHKTPDPEHATPFMVHINEYTEQPQGISWRAPGSSEWHRHDLANAKTAAVDGPDWCTWRHAAQCTFPNDRNNTLLAIPQVRGACPWNTRYAQQICPISEPGPQALMSVKASKALSWDEIGDRHPHVYGDSEIHGDAADGADGPGIGDAANYLAHERPGHHDAEDTTVHDLEFHEKTVHPRHIDYSPSGSDDPRVRSARRGYQEHPDQMPPLVLVKRHNVYHVADGHHRAEAAHGLDMPVKAYVADSPHPNVPFADGDKGPSWGAKPIPKERKQKSRMPKNNGDPNQLKLFGSVSDVDDSWKNPHRAPEADDGSSAPMHDVESMMPDFHAHPEYYDYGQEDFHTSANAIRSAKDNPEKKIRVYRALPAEHAHKGIQTGDWVTTSKEYARAHGRHADDSKHDWPVIRATVPAKHLHTEGDVHEWGYSGPPKGGMVAFKGGYHQEVRHGDEGIVPVKRRPKKEAAMQTPCQTPGAQFHTSISDSRVGLMVDLHKNLDLNESEAILLESNMHNAMEMVLRPYYKTSALSVPQSYELARVARQDPEMAFHVTAAWSDVRNKAKRIRSEGKVMIKAATNEGLAGMVEGDHGTYENMITYRPGTRKIADWSCNCKWGEWAWDRIRFHGRQCSHSLALQYEAQSRGMFGREVHLGALTFGGSETLDERAGETDRPIMAIARSLVEADEEPGDIMKLLMAYGLPHSGALEALASANMTAEEEDERRKKHHHTVDTRRHAPNFGYGVPGWIPLPIGNCSQCQGWGCGHCGGTGQVAQDGYGHDANAVPDQNGDEGQMMSGGISDTSSLLPRYATGATLPVELPAADQATTGPAVNDHGFRGVGVPFRAGGLASVHSGRRVSGVDVIREGLDGHVIQPHAQPVETALSTNRGTPGIAVVAGVVEDELGWDLPDRQQPHEAMQVVRFPLVGGSAVPVATPSTSPHVAGVAGSEHDLAKQAGGKQEVPTVAGVCLKAADTGRILMLQRGLQDEDDPARGTWENPGGHIEPGDQTSLHAGVREFEEEVGQPFPEGGVVHHTWTSPNGIYQGHVVVIPSEKDLRMHEGRVIPNPDDPKGDNHEQAAWWEVDHARKNPALREELKTGTPWNEIAKAGETKTASAWDPLTSEGETPGFPYAAPLHSNSKNPASTGFATSEDPKSWSNENEIPDHLLPSSSYDSSYYGMLHDEPEPALPSTDGADPDGYQPPETHGSIADVEESLSPNQFTGSVTDIVAAFQATAGAKGIMAKTPASTPGGGDVSFDFAAAARQYLAQDKGMQKSALKDFSFPEQQELINEGKHGDVRARNFSNLQIEGTHYEALGKALGLEDEDAEGIFS